MPLTVSGIALTVLGIALGLALLQVPVWAVCKLGVCKLDMRGYDLQFLCTTVLPETGRGEQGHALPQACPYHEQISPPFNLSRALQRFCAARSVTLFVISMPHNPLRSCLWGTEDHNKGRPVHVYCTAPSSGIRESGVTSLGAHGYTSSKEVSEAAAVSDGAETGVCDCGGVVLCLGEWKLAACGANRLGCADIGTLRGRFGDWVCVGH